MMSDFHDITVSQLDAFMKLIDDQTKIENSIVEEQQQISEELMESGQEGALVQEEDVSTTLSPQDNWQGRLGETSTGFHPCGEDWTGPLSFTKYFSCDTVGKTSCLFSSQLNKVFLPMNSSLPVHFTCQWGAPDLYVRALPVFLEADELQFPVTRCSHHMRELDDTNIDFPFPPHVIRCESMDSCYVEDTLSRRLSVLTPLGLPPPGSKHVTMQYKFVCKTSCMGGMNRRPIQVIFTLERHTGEVVGRSAVKVRICSCPKRDMRKEEKVAKEGNPLALPHLDGIVVSEPHKRSTESVDRPRKSKKVKMEKIMHQIPIFGDENLFKECTSLLRSYLLGKKVIAGLPLAADEQKNLDNFNSIIGDVSTSTNKDPILIKEENQTRAADEELSLK